MRATVDLLFGPYTTHVVVECWVCHHEVTLLPGALPAGLTEAEFQRRAKCTRCGARLPHVTAYPRPASRWIGA